MQKKLSILLKKRIESDGTNQTKLAKQLDVSQPTVSRALNGNWSRISPEIRKLMNYCQMDEGEVNPATSKALMKALQQVWDGTPQQEKVLAKLIVQFGEWAHSVNSRPPR